MQQNQMFSQFHALLLVFMCCGGVTVGLATFVYPNAPHNLIMEARTIGEHEKEAFIEELSKLMESETDKMKSLEHEMELYSKHLLVCSTVGSKLTQQLRETIGDQMIEDSHQEKNRKSLQEIGFDDVASRMFTLPAQQIENTINVACLKHELQFECANGFVNNEEKIRENIEKMKAVDGNVKLMFEKECAVEDKNNRILPKIFSCIGDSAQELYSACSSSIQAFNKTASQMNNQIHTTYRHTLNSINDETTLSEEDHKDNVERLENTLHEIKKLESMKCRVYHYVEKCAINTAVELCGERSREIVKTLLRVGRLRRQRGDYLHEHFMDFNIAEHRHCSNYV